MEAISVLKERLTMTAVEERDLWRQRFFEAQAGMERYLLETYGLKEMARWLPVRAAILQDLAQENAAKEDVQSWKERFFRAQARLEKYVADHHGLDDLEHWTAATGQIFKLTEPDRGGGAGDFARRLAKQAHLYRSDYAIEHADRDYARVVLHRCAIWDYREQARQRGVTLTLKSPCQYCTKATVANAGSKGYSATFQLNADDATHGCIWEIRNENTRH